MNIVFNAVLAAVVYGGWAGYSNSLYGALTATKAGIVQAVYAFLATYFVTHAARWIYLRLGRGTMAVMSSLTACTVITAIIPLIAHTAAKTPEILISVLPGLIWGSLYLATFLGLLEYRWKRNRRHHRAALK